MSKETGIIFGGLIILTDWKLKENLIKNGKDAGVQIPTELFISNDIIVQLYDDMKDEGQINEFNEIIKYAECY